MTLYTRTSKREAVVANDVNVVSFVRDLCDQRGWDIHRFRGECVAAQLSVDTADRLYDGDTSTTVRTLAVITKDIFGMDDIGKVMNVAR